MNRSVAVLVAALALCGCAAPKATTAPAPAAAPSVPIPPAPRRGEPQGFVNLPAARLRATFGEPAFVRRDGATEMWRYDGAVCRAFFFLYGDDKNRQVRHVETLPRGQDSAADPACLTALRASAAKTS